MIYFEVISFYHDSFVSQKLCQPKLTFAGAYMVRTVIYNATILALDEDDTFHYPGTIEIEDDKISKIYGGSPVYGTKDAGVV